ncbi:alpha/beta-hydrolase [Testicularia cyperi]|uniref:Alpha/beta-hydrolase n=1 Tax=Testicularia cyperi TaxID=1882483 RepID=A0A317XMH9_9BASI|nr:alpha/beta-hydrolase [Testicularia cyperi]
MRETKITVPLTTREGVTINIVGVLAQIDMPPHAEAEEQPPLISGVTGTLPLFSLSANSTPSSSLAPTPLPSRPSASASQDPSAEAEAQRIDRIRKKDRVFRRRAYRTLPIDSAHTRGRKVAIILHGAHAHKDQTYHKQLARELPVDSFRFDFRANFETPGTWSISGLPDDMDDLQAVVVYLRDTLGYTVEIVVGHSRGALVGFAWLSKYCADSAPPALRVPYFVAVGARFEMSNIHERDPIYIPAFAKEGFYRLRVRVAGIEKEVHLYPSQIEDFANWPTRQITRDFPKKTDVLLIHGTADKTVPVSDVTSYSNMLSCALRRPGSCTVQLIDHADHNFRGFYPQVVEAIISWLDERRELAQVGVSAAALRDAELRGKPETSNPSDHARLQQKLDEIASASSAKSAAASKASFKRSQPGILPIESSSSVLIAESRSKYGSNFVAAAANADSSHPAADSEGAAPAPIKSRL